MARTSLWFSLSLLILVGPIDLCLIGSTDLAAAEDASPLASRLVQEALHRESFGNEGERSRLLRMAEFVDPDFGPAKWQQGKVLFQGEWKPIEQVAMTRPMSIKLAGYSDRRQRSADSVAGNLSLANWCRSNSLFPQERAHLERVVQLDPDHSAARDRLGYRLVDNVWLSGADVQRARRFQESSQQSLARWQDTMLSIEKLFRSSVLRNRAAATSRLLEIVDADAVPAIQSSVTRLNPEAGLASIACFDQLPGQRAVSALSLEAVSSPWAEVRDRAAGYLQQKDPVRFVPELLDAMFTPVVTNTSLVPARRGRLAYEHAFARESRSERQVMVLRREYDWLRASGGDPEQTLLRALQDSRRLFDRWQSAVAQQNLQASMMNQRIADVLALATGQQLPAQPAAWWEWWNQQQDIVVQGSKQTRRIERSDQVTLTNFVPRLGQSFGGMQVGTRPQRGECFVAGTEVWTMTGLRAIETIAIGDEVLSQDVETGELAFKPVLQTTERPAKPLLRLQFTDEEFTTTPGHLFWVAGDGWQKAEKLMAGELLHAVDGARQVSAVDDAVAEPTFNLVVADFHTYFVGTTRILSHDVTSREPTDAVVPGLVDR